MKASPSASSCPVAVAINLFVSLRRQQLAAGPMGAVLISVAARIALMRGRTPVPWSGDFHRTGSCPSSGRGKSKAFGLHTGEQKLQKDAGLQSNTAFLLWLEE